jgi:hypothetical protein
LLGRKQNFDHFFFIRQKKIEKKISDIFLAFKSEFNANFPPSVMREPGSSRKKIIFQISRARRTGNCVQISAAGLHLGRPTLSPERVG